MSVYTELTHDDIQSIVSAYAIGSLQSFSGIAAGIENSNFFINTDKGRFVLTLFERMNYHELPYFMNLMRFLADRGLACPDVMMRDDASLLFRYEHQYGCIVSCMHGQTFASLNDKQLCEAGKGLARLHVLGADFSERRQNSTAFAWMQETAIKVLPLLRQSGHDAAASLLIDELSWQQKQSFVVLPKGLIHADYFADNIMFEGDRLSGIIDFYYACDDVYIYDLAIAANALAGDAEGLDQQKMQLLLQAYQTERSLSDAELKAWPAMLRLAALRFWVSRLYDALFPREGSVTQVKDPLEYQKKLTQCRSL